MYRLLAGEIVMHTARRILDIVGEVVQSETHTAQNDGIDRHCKVRLHYTYTCIAYYQSGKDVTLTCGFISSVLCKGVG